MGKRLPRNRHLRQQILVAGRSRLGRPVRSRTGNRPTQPLKPQNLQSRQKHHQRRRFHVPGHLLPRRRRRDHPKLLENRPLHSILPLPERNPLSDPRNLHQLHPPPHSLSKSHRRLLGRRFARFERECRSLFPPNRERDSSDMEQRPLQH